MSITADLGIIGVVPGDLGEAYVNQHIALVRPNPLMANGRWLGHYLASPRGQDQFRRLNDQGAKAGLNLQAVGNLEVALPPFIEQARRVAVLDTVDKRIGQLSAEIVKWRRFKAGVMADLFSGRIRYPDGVAS